MSPKSLLSRLNSSNFLNLSPWERCCCPLIIPTASSGLTLAGWCPSYVRDPRAGCSFAYRVSWVQSRGPGAPPLPCFWCSPGDRWLSGLCQLMSIFSLDTGDCPDPGAVPCTWPCLTSWGSHGPSSWVFGLLAPLSQPPLLPLPDLGLNLLYLASLFLSCYFDLHPLFINSWSLPQVAWVLPKVQLSTNSLFIPGGSPVTPSSCSGEFPALLNVERFPGLRQWGKWVHYPRGGLHLWTVQLSNTSEHLWSVWELWSLAGFS